jgi:branched-chain amino acid transport system substrate-binding protein
MRRPSSIARRLRRHGYAWVAFAGLVLGSGCVHEGAAWYFEPSELRLAERDIQRELDALNDQVADAAKALADMPLAEAGAQAVLDGLAGSNGIIAAGSIVDSSGKMLAIAPATYQATLGTDLSKLPHIVAMAEAKTPALTPVIPTPQGSFAVALQWPILAEDGSFLGSVGVSLRYAALLEQVLHPIYSDSLYDAWVIQTDGQVLFDRDPNERGRCIFKDGFYRSFPDFVTLAHEIATKKEGRGTARFLTTGHHSIRPQAYVWSTVGLHGTEWRVVLGRDAS